MKPVIGAAVLGLLAVGGVVLATSRHGSSPPAAASSYTDSAAVPMTPVNDPYAQVPATGLVPVASTTTTVAAPQTRVVYRDRVVTRRVATRPRRHTRSTKHSVMIVGGSTVGGAVIGGLVGGKKGAVIGGLVGGAGGTVYDRKTRHRPRRD